MKLDKFYAVTATEAPFEAAEGLTSVKLETVTLGTLPLPSKRVNISDGLILDAPASFEVPETSAEVVLTIADLSKEQDGSHRRVAYMSLLFSKEAPHALKPAVAIDYDFSLAISVDTGTVAFYDTVEYEKLSIGGYIDYHAEEFTDVIQAVLEEAEGNGGYGTFVKLPEAHGADGLLAVASSGFGDGVYGVTEAVAEDGTILGLHLDFLVVGKEEWGTD